MQPSPHQGQPSPIDYSRPVPLRSQLRRDSMTLIRRCYCQYALVFLLYIWRLEEKNDSHSRLDCVRTQSDVSVHLLRRQAPCERYWTKNVKSGVFLCRRRANPKRNEGSPIWGNPRFSLSHPMRADAARAPDHLSNPVPSIAHFLGFAGLQRQRLAKYRASPPDKATIRIKPLYEEGAEPFRAQPLILGGNQATS
jgi:hypothetical protein